MPSITVAVGAGVNADVTADPDIDATGDAGAFSDGTLGDDAVLNSNIDDVSIIGAILVLISLVVFPSAFVTLTYSYSAAIFFYLCNFRSYSCSPNCY